MLLDLPTDVLTYMLLAVARGPDPAALLRLQCTCVGFGDVLAPPCLLWDVAWETASQLPYAREQAAKCPKALLDGMASRDKLRLTAGQGCMLCPHHPRTRKVHWQFGVRCCTDCLHDNTISDYRLRQEFGIFGAPLDTLPSVSKAMWGGRHVGSYALTFFWKDMVLPELRRAYGPTATFASVRDMHARTAQEAMQRERERTARVAVRKAQLDAFCAEEGIDTQLASHASPAYARNAKLQAQLKRSAFAKILPKIRRELEEYAEAAQRAAQEAAQRAAQEAERAALRARGQALRCPLCPDRGPFTYQGLLDHTRAKHAGQESRCHRAVELLTA